ncbi:hypothetical protein ElyMa_001325900 [Elysia marginata]|uniref:Uncharacterized protein n=1 Tax=Elysia marginata TaxID=1093978 RepID=A0AAV4IKJ1_9GAST|nr:hypothetical protein ElyMa_001325900 [Elysia marginata]
MSGKKLIHEISTLPGANCYCSSSSLDSPRRFGEGMGGGTGLLVLHLIPNTYEVCSGVENQLCKKKKKKNNNNNNNKSKNNNNNKNNKNSKNNNNNNNNNKKSKKN